MSCARGPELRESALAARDPGSPAFRWYPRSRRARRYSPFHHLRFHQAHFLRVWGGVRALRRLMRNRPSKPWCSPRKTHPSPPRCTRAAALCRSKSASGMRQRGVERPPNPCRPRTHRARRRLYSRRPASDYKKHARDYRMGVALGSDQARPRSASAVTIVGRSPYYGRTAVAAFTARRFYKARLAVRRRRRLAAYRAADDREGPTHIGVATAH